MQQASEAARRADLAAAHDSLMSGARAPDDGPHMGPHPDGPAEGAGGGKKGLKGWGDRVKEMKERAEKAKAKISHK